MTAPDIVHFATGLPLSRQRFYGVGLVKRDVHLPPRGEWSGSFLLGLTGISLSYHGDFRRTGRWLWLRAAPKRQARMALRPAVTFG